MVQKNGPRVQWSSPYFTLGCGDFWLMPRSGNLLKIRLETEWCMKKKSAVPLEVIAFFLFFNLLLFQLHKAVRTLKSNVQLLG